MIIEQFNLYHFIMLALGLALTFGIYFALRKRSDKTKYYVMLGIEILNLLIYIFRMLRICRASWFNIWDELPLHLCNLSLILNLVGIISKNETLYHYSYFIGSIGGIMALVFPTPEFLGTPLYEIGNMSFYLQHILVANCGFLLYSLGFFKIKLRKLVLSNLLLFGCAIIAHIVNISFTYFGLGKPIYLFTTSPHGVFILEFFWSILPVPLLYLVFAAPLLALTDTVLCLPVILKKRRDKK